MGGAVMRHFVTICLILFLNLYLSATQSNSENNDKSKPVFIAIRINQEIELTGKLDHDFWKSAAPVELQYEIRPGENTPAPEKTLVRALYNDDYLYFGFECFDSNPKNIRANVTDRDRMFQDDYVIVVIDTYNDYQKAYELAVNPYGIQGDLMATLNGEDHNFNIIWHSAAAINDNGWTAEIAIPFSSIHFSDQEDQTWCVNIVRNYPRESRIQISWTPFDRNLPSFIAQGGLLKGLKGIESNGAIEILPYAIGQQNGNLTDPANPNSGLEQGAITGRFGGGIRYSPSANFSLDAVINPDFSQIESDAAQISVNTTFALHYQEKRPFFLVGNELLQTPMYYSRSINNPLAAGRVIGKSGSLSYMYLSAYDRNTVFVIPGEEQSSTVPTSLKSLANIGRIRYDMGNNSYIGGMVLAKNIGDAHNYLVGFDWNYKFWENWFFNGEGFISHTQELNDSELFSSTREFGTTGHNAGFDGEEYFGSGIHLVLSHSQRSYNFAVVYNDFSPTYQTYNGLFGSVGHRQFFMNHGYVFYPEDSFIDRGQIELSTNLTYNYEGLRKEVTVQPSFNVTLKGQTNLNLTYLLVNNENFRGVQFENVNRVQFFASSQPLNEISFHINGQIGKFIYRSSEPVIGTGHNLGAELTFRPTSKLNLAVSYNRARLSNLETDELFYDGNIYRAVAIYQFTPQIFFRTITQYNSFGSSFNIYPLFSYKYDAFTTFYAGISSDYVDYSGEYGFTNIGRQYFVKLQYMFRN